MGIWYCTREDVASALGFGEAARLSAQLDRACESAARAVEGLTHRRFYPQLATRYFSWPGGAGYRGSPSRSGRLWLDQDEVISVTSLSSGGASLAGQFFLYPTSGPPFTAIELDASTSAAFSTASARQRSIALTGLFGYSDDARPAGILASGMDGSTTTLILGDSSMVGVGSLLRVDSERMVVTDRRMSTVSQTLQADLAGQASATVVQVALGTGYIYPGEVLLIDGERMLVVDSLATTVVVKRAYDGTPLAAHTSGATIYASRTLTVSRAAVGTTAAAHTGGAVLTSWAPPGLIRALAVAEAINTVEQESSAYARTVGSGDGSRNASGAGIADIRQRAYDRHGRKARLGVV